MQSQTLSLEGKLELIRTAIEALPDYTAKLEAITSAIEALPDYSDKLAAIEAALEAGFLDQKTAHRWILPVLKSMLPTQMTAIFATNSTEFKIAKMVAQITTGIR